MLIRRYLRPHLSSLIPVTLIVTLICLFGLPPPQAQANGRILRYETQTANPYTISFGTSPQTPTVGPLHLSVFITINSEGAPTPVLDAIVTVTAVRPDSGAPEIGPTELANNPVDLSFYETTVMVPKSGIWAFVLDIVSDHGSAGTQFEVNVQESSPLIGLLTLLVLLSLITILSISFRSYLRQR